MPKNKGKGEKTAPKALNSVEYMKQFKKAVHGNFLHTNLMYEMFDDNDELYEIEEWNETINLSKCMGVSTRSYDESNSMHSSYPDRYIVLLYQSDYRFIVRIPMMKNKNTRRLVMKKITRFLHSLSMETKIDKLTGAVENLHNLIAYQPFGLIEQQMKIAFDHYKFQLGQEQGQGQGTKSTQKEVE